MEITVKSRFLKTTPRKLRLVADWAKRKKATDAVAALKFLNKAAAKPVAKSLSSALAIAKEKQLDENSFYLTRVSCDQGPRLKRRIMKSRGQSSQIQKRMSHLTLTISDKPVVNKKEAKNGQKSITN